MARWWRSAGGGLRSLLSSPHPSLQSQSSLYHTIQAIPREFTGNRISAKDRAQGRIPAVVFAQPPPEHSPKPTGRSIARKHLLTTERKQIQAILNSVELPYFCSTTFPLQIRAGSGSSVLLESGKIHRDEESGKILNLVFVWADEGSELKVDVPVTFKGEDVCPGLKKGSHLNKIRTSLKYLCPAEHIPPKIEVDISNLDIGDRVCLPDVKVHPSLKLLSKNDVIPILSSRKSNRDQNRLQINEHDLRLDFPVRSASTSLCASPRFSPRRTPGDLGTPSRNQGWSAPEMNSNDMTQPPSAFLDVFSNESSPINSPTGRSPLRQPQGSSPLHPLLSVTSEVHPLPLPPGASLPSPSVPPSPSLLSPQPAVTPKQESQPIKGQWQKGKLIGRGTFGSVYVATNRKTGALCAMKEVELLPDDPKSAECIKQLQQEIKVLSQLKHPNIVQYYGSEIVEDRFFIYLEYVHPGSINKYVHEHYDGAMTEAVVRSFTRHILSGLAYLHSKKTIHRDIKGANLLVDSFGAVKLADFGMAKHLSGHVGNLSLKGSPYWMAPELMQSEMNKDNSSDLALAVDIWSLGCTIIEMFTGKPPWSQYEGAAAMFKVIKDTPPIPETLSPEGKDFLRSYIQDIYAVWDV
ncbi:hypothetical protein ACLB2K_003627 [Fragaria x ananassa]